MFDITINEFDDCQQCGACCQTPCELIPADLPPLLRLFRMSLPEFFRKYLIALIIASRKSADEVLMMVPVRTDSTGKRPDKFLADNEYLSTQGNCIFLVKDQCQIHEYKPYGGRFLQCGKMTKSVPIQLSKNQYFAYWRHNQHLFNSIFPGYTKVFDQIISICQDLNEINDEREHRQKDYDRLFQDREEVIKAQLFPLFNRSVPAGGFKVFFMNGE